MLTVLACEELVGLPDVTVLGVVDVAGMPLEVVRTAVATSVVLVV